LVLRYFLDRRPLLNNIPVLLYGLALGYEPHAWVIASYGFLCSLVYSYNLSQLLPILQLMRTLFPFQPLEVNALLPSGFVDLPLAIIRSILSAFSLKFEIRSLFFLFGSPALVWKFRRIGQDRFQLFRHMPVWYYQLLPKFGTTVKYAKRLALFSLLVYLAVYSIGLSIQQYHVIQIASHSPMTENVTVTASVSAIVIHAKANAQTHTAVTHNPSPSYLDLESPRKQDE
jgi:hypothetical protein